MTSANTPTATTMAITFDTIGKKKNGRIGGSTTSMSNTLPWPNSEGPPLCISAPTGLSA